MVDHIRNRFLEGAEEDARTINLGSDILGLAPRSFEHGYATGYFAILRDVEHFVKKPGEEPRVVTEPILFDVNIPDDYLRSDDSHLFMRVIHVLSPVYHPSVGGMTLCLGQSFRSGTRLRALMHQLWAIFAAGRFATDSPLDREARDFYLANLERVRALKAPPLFRSSVLTSVRRVDAQQPSVVTKKKEVEP